MGDADPTCTLRSNTATRAPRTDENMSAAP